MHDKERSWSKWWVSAALCALLVTLAFIGLTLYIGNDMVTREPPPILTRYRPASQFPRHQAAYPKTVLPSTTTTTTTQPPPPSSTPKQEDFLEDPDPDYIIQTDHLDSLTLESLYNQASVRRKASPYNDIPEFAYISPPPYSPLPILEEDPTETEKQDTTQYTNPLFEYLRKKLRDTYNYIVPANQQISAEWNDLLDTINESIAKQDASLIMNKVKDLYQKTGHPKTSILTNTSSLVSFGLLAVDLFLLHNVQQIAWNEERSLGASMLQDPEVLAMNSLFLSPDKVRESRFLDELRPKGAFQELIDFVSGALRAVFNLSRAYKSSQGKSANTPTTLDCIWTLYCRNLDKTAALEGPYGFLAKMNSLGLRLMMGEFPVEKALERLIIEFTGTRSKLDCENLFPRCSAEEAKNVVLATALGSGNFDITNQLKESFPNDRSRP